ncbi:hypothetical protein C1H46_026139 [Malus baccata]|uniref:Uncharacterized protein n=1 Tax=Malus baccata TaxID=106549 RepID=A0A540LPD0_MALBA|nr:hypothetical protein C1H46_026139 [Malus baccata]
MYDEYHILRATLVFMDPMNTGKFISLSEQPLAPKACNFSLSFLPCYQCPVKSQDYEPVVVDNCAGKWCLAGSASVSRMVMRNALINKVGVLAFDPNNEDILYLELSAHIVMCNIRARKARKTSRITPVNYAAIGNSMMAVFPYMLPWWPTPVTRLKSGSSTSNHVAGAGKKRKANDEDTKVDNKQSTAADLFMRTRYNFHADKLFKSGVFSSTASTRTITGGEEQKRRPHDVKGSSAGSQHGYLV